MLITLERDSCEKVEATCNKAAIGLEFPIFANSAMAKLSSLVFGSMVPNFSLIKSRAAATSMAYYCLLANSSASATRLASNSLYLSFNIDNYEVLTPISAVNYPIYPFNTEISFSASVFSLVLSAIVLSKAAMVSAHSYSYLICSASASAYYVAKSCLISANILAMSPKGELADNYKAIVSNNFFPKVTSSTLKFLL